MLKRSFVLVTLVVAVFGLSTTIRADNSVGEVSLNKISKNVQTKKVASVAATSLHQWVLSRMVTWLPPGRSLIRDAIETHDEGKARYEKIADAAISVVYDPNERSIFGGKYGRAKTLALILAVAYFESGFRKDVDRGLGPLARGDGGQSWCMMQILLGRPGADGDTRKRISMEGDYYKTYFRPVQYIDHKSVYPKDTNRGWGGKDLVMDRRKCFRTGLHLIRKSFDACSRIPVVDRLSVYGAGRCIVGMKSSRIRVKKAQEWLAKIKPPLVDKEVMQLLHPLKTVPNNDGLVNVGPISKAFDNIWISDPFFLLPG